MCCGSSGVLSKTEVGFRNGNVSFCMSMQVQSMETELGLNSLKSFEIINSTPFGTVIPIPTSSLLQLITLPKGSKNLLRNAVVLNLLVSETVTPKLLLQVHKDTINIRKIGSAGDSIR